MSNQQYFIQSAHGKLQGPFDLLSMMRKIHTHKINTGTLVSTDSAAWRGAAQFPELADFFMSTAKQESTPVQLRRTAEMRFSSALSTGWRFAGTNPMIFVFSSLGIALCIAAGLLLTGLFPWWLCLGASVALYLMLQSTMMAVVLQVYRGQQLSGEFFKTRFAPALVPLLLGSLVIGVLGLTGLALLIIPGLIILSLLAFTPFLMVEHHLPLAQAMQESVSVARSRGGDGFGAVLALISVNILSLFIIITLPFTLPVIAVALAELFEDLSGA